MPVHFSSPVPPARATNSALPVESDANWLVEIGPATVNAPLIKSGSSVPARRFLMHLDRLGPLNFAILFTLFCASAVWLVGGLVTSWWWHPPGFVNDLGADIGRDFIIFYSGSTAVLAGHAGAVYNSDAFHAINETVIGAPVAPFAFLYPPTYLLLLAPLALAPYLVSLVLWLAVPLLALMRFLRRIMPHPLTPLVALIFPGTSQCLLSGQNGILSALMLAGGLLNLEKRPVFAGLIFAFLSYKPHLAIAVFAVLFFGRHWRALSSALIGTAILGVASVAAFGIEPWAAFFASFGETRMIIETGVVPWDRMVSIFAAARLAGLGITASYLLQIAVALGTLATLAWTWRRRNGSLALRGSVLIIAIPLMTPYVYDYDLVMLLLPIAWLVRAGMAVGFRRGEAALLAAAWACPVAGWLFAEWSHLQVTPIVLMLLLCTTARCVAADTGSDEGHLSGVLTT